MYFAHVVVVLLVVLLGLFGGGEAGVVEFGIGFHGVHCCVCGGVGTREVG